MKAAVFIDDRGQIVLTEDTTSLAGLGDNLRFIGWTFIPMVRETEVLPDPTKA